MNARYQKKCIFAAHLAIALLCNGSTADSGSVCMGSNPIGATKNLNPYPRVQIFFVFLHRNFNTHCFI